MDPEDHITFAAASSKLASASLNAAQTSSTDSSMHIGMSQHNCPGLQVDDLLLQQQDEQQRQQARQEALASLKASIAEELRPQRQQLHDAALAALHSEVANQVQASMQICSAVSWPFPGRHFMHSQYHALVSASYDSCEVLLYPPLASSCSSMLTSLQLAQTACIGRDLMEQQQTVQRRLPSYGWTLCNCLGLQNLHLYQKAHVRVDVVAGAAAGGAGCCHKGDAGGHSPGGAGSQETAAGLPHPSMLHSIALLSTALSCSVLQTVCR